VMGLDGGRRLHSLRLCVAASKAGHECRLCGAGDLDISAAARSERHFDVLVV
jgi:hypothetical protein